MRQTLAAVLLLLTSCPRPNIQQRNPMPPIAVIMPGDQNVQTGMTITLDGSSSYHAEGKPLTYAWRTRSRPMGSISAVSSSTDSSVTYTCDVAGSYVVELVVTADGVDSSPALVVLTATGANTLLQADAGPDRVASITRALKLDGRGSRGPPTAVLSYSWSVTSKPAGSTASLTNGSTAEPSFVADTLGAYDVQLTVSANGASASDTVRITVVPENHAPIARVGQPQRVMPGDTVQLDGTASSDPDGDVLSFRWTVRGQPTGSSVALSAPMAAQTTFVPTVQGTYVIELQVSDQEPLTSTANTTVTVGNIVQVVNDVFDPGEVYLAGTLSEGACYMDAIAHWSDPNVSATGFDCYFDNRAAMVRPSDGRLLYTNTFEDKLRSFTCDNCPFDGGSYPTMVLANDPILPTPCPTATDELGTFTVSPQGQVLHTCNTTGSRWRNQAGTEVFDATGDQLWSYGYNDLVLTRSRVVKLGTMMMSTISGLPSRSWLTTRALMDGFWIALPGASMTNPPELWKVDENGVATKVGDYPALPANVTARFSSKLDRDGALFEMASDTSVSFRDVIVRRKVAGTSDVVYTEASNPRVKIHISDLVTGP